MRLPASLVTVALTAVAAVPWSMARRTGGSRLSAMDLQQGDAVGTFVAVARRMPESRTDVHSDRCRLLATACTPDTPTV